MNRLGTESSLYLRQHANNPVDWFPWGTEAIAHAKQTDRPIFLSIGYSACHWCHVMEHESFEDPATAKILNDHFVAIKVDREERPDLDAIYMTALQVITREGGGWPLSVWLTPDLHPFYAGTYFPPDNRYAPQRPSFKQLLLALDEAWKQRRSEIDERSGAITEHLRQMDRTIPPSEGKLLSLDLLDAATQQLRRSFDKTHGGFGYAPKFPHAIELRMLLRVAKRSNDPVAVEMIRLSLDKMAMGGVYDQIGGGFHRYSVDERWLVPHFEKMLYDNALLASAYTEAWQWSAEPSYQEVAREILDYVLREMTSPAGAFYSTQDADSEGEEGIFYIWSKKELVEVLGNEEATLFCQAYGVSDAGNFEGHNILNRSKAWATIATACGESVETLRRRLKNAATKLYEVRAKRIWPGRDEKILTSWNALMVTAFAQAASAFGEPRYLLAAQQAADFLLNRLRDSDGKLYRTCGHDQPPRLHAYLEDYACLIDALVVLYGADFQPRWIAAAVELAERMIERFADPEGGFYYTGNDHETLIARTKDTYDGSTPSGNSMTATALAKLAVLTERNDFALAADSTLQSFATLLQESPGAVGQMLTALDFQRGVRQEIVVFGSTGDSETRELLSLLRKGFHPNRTIAFHDPVNDKAPETLIPLFKGRNLQGQVTTYICENATCLAPLSGVDAVRQALLNR